MTRKEWEVLRDPARPLWPGLLVVGPSNAFIQVAAGDPQNCADSASLADRIASALNQQTGLNSE